MTTAIRYFCAGDCHTSSRDSANTSAVCGGSASEKEYDLDSNKRLFAVCSVRLPGPCKRAKRGNAPATDHFDYAELTKAPAKARARKNPQEGNTEAALVGRKLFMQHCAECHGATADGGKKAPSLLVDQVQQATPGALFWLLTNGVVRRGMPVWSKLPEPQRWAIVIYIKSLRPLPPAQHVESDNLVKQ